MTPFVERHVLRTSVVRLRPSEVEAADLSWSTLPSRRCTCACGSAWATSSRMGFLPVLPVRIVPKTAFPHDDTMSIRRSLSTVKGSPLSTRRGIPSCFSVREIARRSSWCWFTCATALGQMRACCVSTSTALQQGHLTVQRVPQSP